LVMVTKPARRPLTPVILTQEGSRHSANSRPWKPKCLAAHDMTPDRVSALRGERMPSHKTIVAAYLEGFRRGDHQQILALLTDDVTWDLPGYAHLEGKEAFDREIENELFVGNPTITVDRVIEEGETVVAIGSGAETRKSGEEFRFAYCDVFTFSGDLIRRVESYLVPLNGQAHAVLS
jgi:ketosteroid isomerase-like protein